MWKDTRKVKDKRKCFLQVATVCIGAYCISISYNMQVLFSKICTLELCSCSILYQYHIHQASNERKNKKEVMTTRKISLYPDILNAAESCAKPKRVRPASEKPITVMAIKNPASSDFTFISSHSHLIFLGVLLVCRRMLGLIRRGRLCSTGSVFCSRRISRDTRTLHTCP